MLTRLKRLPELKNKALYKDMLARPEQTVVNDEDATGRGRGRLVVGGGGGVGGGVQRVRSRVNASALSCRRAERSQQLVNVKVARDMLQEARGRRRSTHRER